MTKSLMSLMTAVMAVFFGMSITACSVDYDGFECDEPELVGTWDAITSQFYVENEGYSMPGLGDGYLVITQNTITEFDHKNNITMNAEGYTFDGRKINIEGQSEREVVTLSQQQMLIRTIVAKSVYRETTYKRRK